MTDFNPFDTYLIENPDFNETDQRQQIEQLFFRQRAIQSLVSGDLSPEELLDLLEFQDIDPVAYVDCVTQNLDFVLRGA